MLNKNQSITKFQTLQKSIDEEVNPNDLFFQLSNGGHTEGSIFFQLGNTESTYQHLSIGVYQPSLAICGRKNQFVVKALDEIGEQLIKTIKMPNAILRHGVLTGSLNPDLSQVSITSRLSARNHTDLLKQCLFPIDHDNQRLPIGLFGCFAYDFIRQFEAIPMPQHDCLKEYDYVFYFATNLFIVDHLQHKTTFISLYQTPDQKKRAEKEIARMEKAAQSLKSIIFPRVYCNDLQSDTNFNHYKIAVNTIKDHINKGDVFQAVYGRMMSATCFGNPLAIYNNLTRINPSPFNFYMQDMEGTLVGASPELALRVVKKDQGHRVEIHPIAGTKPRGKINGMIDQELDQRYAMAMQVDEKELAEHTMLIDLARNDIASIALPGTTKVDKAFEVQKFSHVQHLVSKVSGQLNPNYHALQAYLATMNMGTLTGAPKVSAINIINRLEINARGYFGGAFGFITAEGELETTIIIRSMRLKDNKVYIRAGGGIVADSLPENEWLETENKSRACAKALKEFQHVA